MEKIRKLIKNKKDYDKFSLMLQESLKRNDPFSDRPMLDGMIIGFILTTPFSKDLFLNKEMGRVLDGTLQKLEQIVIWVLNNEDGLCDRFITRKTKSNRELSMEIWNDLPFNKKIEITQRNSETLFNRTCDNLTGREIQMLWESGEF